VPKKKPAKPEWNVDSEGRATWLDVGYGFNIQGVRKGDMFPASVQVVDDHGDTVYEVIVEGDPSLEGLRQMACNHGIVFFKTFIANCEAARVAGVKGAKKPKKKPYVFGA